MPGKKGFEVLEELKKQHIKTSFIILSNLSQEEDVVKAREMGAIDFFIKSDIPIADIVSLIKKDLRP
jgi:DNA-binding response OmpR family regulator